MVLYLALKGGASHGRTGEAPRPCLPTPVPTAGGAGRHRAGLLRNVDIISQSAFLPAYPARAGRGIKPTCPWSLGLGGNE